MILKRGLSKIERILVDKSDSGKIKWLRKNGAYIGKNTTLSRSIIAAGAVVTKDIPENVVAAGITARVVDHM